VPENVPATVYARPKMSQGQPTGNEETPRQISNSPKGPGVGWASVDTQNRPYMDT